MIPLNITTTTTIKFDPVIMCNRHNPKSIPKPETYNVHWNFEIQTDHLTLARLPEHMIDNNNNKNKERTCHIGHLTYQIKDKN